MLGIARRDRKRNTWIRSMKSRVWDIVERLKCQRAGHVTKEVLERYPTCCIGPHPVADGDEDAYKKIVSKSKSTHFRFWNGAKVGRPDQSHF